MLFHCCHLGTQGDTDSISAHAFMVATAWQHQFGVNLTLAFKYFNQKVIHVTFTFNPLGRIYNMTTPSLKGAEKSSPMYRKREDLKISEWQ